MKLESRVWTLSSGRKLFFDALTPAADGTVSGVVLDPPLTLQEKQEIAMEMIPQWLAWSIVPKHADLLRWLAQGQTPLTEDEKAAAKTEFDDR